MPTTFFRLRMMMLMLTYSSYFLSYSFPILSISVLYISLYMENILLTKKQRSDEETTHTNFAIRPIRPFDHHQKIKKKKKKRKNVRSPTRIGPCGRGDGRL